MAQLENPPEALKSTKQKLKIGLIVDSEIVSKYVYELAEWGQHQESLSISHLIIQQKKEKPRQSKISRVIDAVRTKGIKRIIEIVVWKLIDKLESAKIGKHALKDHLQAYDASGIVLGSIVVRPNVSKSGFVHRFSSEEINAIKGFGLDVLIRCGSGILHGDILNASRLGILSFHHGDNRINRGMPAGFWEVYKKQEETGFIIQQLTEELDGGNVLLRGAFLTQSYFFLNQAHLYSRSNLYMKKLLEDIASTSVLPKTEEKFPYFNELFKTPPANIQISYLFQITFEKLKSLVELRLLGLQQRWGVAFSRTDWTKLVMWRAKTITNPPHHFLADPFVITEDGRDYCFVEDFDFRKSRGCISVYELGEVDALRIGEAIVEPFHMSFPYLFRYKSKIYMIPETCENRDIRLYECVDFPNQWKLTKILMSDLSAADSMVFEYQERWWLFTNINPLDPVEAGDNCCELSIFSSDNPVEGDWIAHSKNPVIIKPSNARNAGILFRNDEVYRVGQRQGFGQYGKGFSINRISLLNQDEYLEEEQCSVEANFFRNLKGTHHLHSNGKITVFDFVQSARITH